MRRSLLGLAIVLGLSGVASEARAQVPFTNINDPFFAYYSYYLPRQQALANQSGPEATISAVTANRQAFAATGRNDMFDPAAPNRDIFDNNGDFSPTGKSRRRAPTSVAGRYGVHGGNLNGMGPAGYFNSGTNIAYRDLRRGIGRNANVAVTRARGISGGGLGGLGLPGPR